MNIPLNQWISLALRIFLALFSQKQEWRLRQTLVDRNVKQENAATMEELREKNHVNSDTI